MEVKDLLQWCMEKDVILSFVPTPAKLEMELVWEGDKLTAADFFELIEIIDIKDTEIKLDFDTCRLRLTVSKGDSLSFF